jgi:hypothetical protein
MYMQINLLATVFFVLFAFQGISQNVGIGTTIPSAKLSIQGAESSVNGQAAAIRITNNAAGGGSWYLRAGAIGTTTPASGFSIGDNAWYRLVIDNAGRVGIGTTSPDETLDIASGNLQFGNTPKGIILNAADRPFITRGFDAFTSGNYAGLGRWGMFMEPNRLVLGIPFVSGKAFEFSKYLLSSQRTPLLTIHGEAGEVRRPRTDNVDLLPICIGSVAVNGGIRGGSGNFTILKDIGSGMTEITISGISYNSTDYAVIATCYSDNNVKAFPMVVADNGKLRIWQYNDGGGAVNQAFSFVVYRLN